MTGGPTLDAVAGAGARSDHLLCESQGRRYVLPLARVLEVVPATILTPVPRAPAAILGVFNLRGQVMTALAPGRLSSPLEAADAPARGELLVVLEAQQSDEGAAPLRVALLVERVLGFCDVGADAGEATPLDPDALCREVRAEVEARSRRIFGALGAGARLFDPEAGTGTT